MRSEDYVVAEEELAAPGALDCIDDHSEEHMQKERHIVVRLWWDTRIHLMLVEVVVSLGAAVHICDPVHIQVASRLDSGLEARGVYYKRFEHFSALTDGRIASYFRAPPAHAAPFLFLPELPSLVLFASKLLVPDVLLLQSRSRAEVCHIRVEEIPVAQQVLLPLGQYPLVSRTKHHCVVVVEDRQLVEVAG